jgi:hypothetical protein
VKGVVNMAKTAVKSTFKALGAGLKATGKGFIKQASKVKFFVKNIGKNIGRGAKNLDDFGKRLASKLKFKGFKIKMSGFRFSLYGNINPWVLLANGDIRKVKKSQLEPGAKIKTRLRIDGTDAVYLGKHEPKINSSRAKELINSNFTIDHIAELSTLNKGFEIAELLAKNTKHSNDQIVEIVQLANRFNLDEQIERLLKSGQLENPEKLRKMLQELDEVEPKLGNYHELNIADDITSGGKKAEFDTQGDVVNLGDKIVYQAKRVESPDADAVFHNIQSADNQLAHFNSKGTQVKAPGLEEPLPGFKRYANIEVHNSMNSLYKLNRKTLLRHLNQAVDDLHIRFNPSHLGDGLATHRVIIKNGKGIFEFIIKNGRFI